MAKISITAEVAREWLDYDPATGVFRWLKSPAKHIRAGVVAGTVGKSGYRYISVAGKEMPAQRWAWLILNGEMPDGKVTFRDGRRDNIRAVNLALNRATPEEKREAGRSYYERNRTALSAKDRERKFGVDLAAYSAMVAAQNNCCAICDRPETATRNGRVKALAVDHDHATGMVRGLLCADCNQAIGKMREDRGRLLSAIRYLDKHSGAAVVAPLKMVE